MAEQWSILLWGGSRGLSTKERNGGSRDGPPWRERRVVRLGGGRSWGHGTSRWSRPGVKRPSVRGAVSYAEAQALASDLHLHLHLAYSCRLCDPGQVPHPFWAPAVSLVR